jgi:hypothetical protein
MKILFYGIGNTQEEMEIDGNIELVNVTYLKYLPFNSFNKEYKYRRYVDNPDDGYRSFCEINEVDFASLPSDVVFNYEGSPFEAELITNIEYEDEFPKCYGGEKYNIYLPFKGDILLLRGTVVGIFGTMNCEDYYPYSRIYLAIELIFSILKHKKDTEEIE